MSSFYAPPRRILPFPLRAAILPILFLLLIRGHAAAQVRTDSMIGTGMDSLPTVRLDSLLDLDHVIRRALAVSPTSSSAAQDVRTATSAERVANGEWLPSFTGNAQLLNSNITTVQLAGVPPASYSAGVAAALDLFTGGRRRADRARAAADLTAAEANDVTQRYQVTYAAQQAYYGTLRASDLVDVSRARVTEAVRSLRYASDRVRAGTTTRSDELRAQLELTNAQQQLVGALDSLQTAGYELGRLVGADGPVGGRRPASLDPRALALTDSAVLRLAIESSPAVQATAAQQRADVAALRATRTEYIPDIKLAAGYNWANQSVISSAVRPGWTVLLGTTYPIFNGFRREDDVVRAAAAAEVSRVTAEDQVRQARADAARLLSGLRFATRNIELAVQGVASATEDLRVQSERYRAGIATELDLLTSQTALAQAQVSLVTTRYDYQLTRAQLEALVGRSL